MIEISVIIPVFNTEAYLAQCLDSVLGQGFDSSEMEVICVDSDSKDGSLRILQEYAERDPRVRVLSIFGAKAPGPCRNKGLDEACGKYVFFLDSDDFLAEGALKRLYACAEEDGCDVVSCDFFVYNNQTKAVSPRSRAFELPFKKTLDAFKGDGPDEFAKFAFSLPFVWGKLIRREMIESAALRFPEGAAEDVPFCVSCLVLSKRAKMLEGEHLVYYRVARAGNISGVGEKMVLDGIRNFAVLEQNLKKYGVFDAVKETFWFNKMILLIGDERLFAGRLGNVPRQTVLDVYVLIRPDMEGLDEEMFKDRGRMFRWKVRHFKKAVLAGDVSFPRKVRKLRNVLMPVLEPWFKLVSKNK